MKKNNFIKNVINLLVVSISLNTCSCMLKESNKESEHSTASIDTTQTSSEITDISSVERSHTSEVSSSEQSTTTESTEPSESINRDNYIGIILDNPGTIDTHAYNDEIAMLGGSELNIGYDNDFTRDKIRECFNDDSLNVCDIAYFQDLPQTGESVGGYVFSEMIYDPYIRASMNLARYFLSANGFTFITDEVPASFFKEKFPDFVAEFPTNGGFLFDLDDYTFYDFTESIGENFYYNFTYSDDIVIDKKCLYYSLQEYDAMRRSLMRRWGVDQERCLANINGQEIEINRLKYDAQQYNEITEMLKKAYGYEINILEPETMESLQNNGLKIENYEDFYNTLCGGTDFTYETYYSIKDRVEGQRSRG